MRRITRNNYEMFFLDYLEGNLDGEELSALETFLEENEDLNAELQEMEIVQLIPEEPSFSGKEMLMKSRFNEDFEDFCIARMEGDLEETEARAFEKHLLKNEKRYREASIYEKLRLDFDSELRCPGKKEFQRKQGIIALPQLYSGIAVAASLLLFWGIWWQFNTEVPEPIAQSEVNSDIQKMEVPQITPKEKIATIEQPSTALRFQSKQAEEPLTVLPRHEKSISKPAISKTDAEPLLAELKRVPLIRIPVMQTQPVEIKPIQVNEHTANLLLYDTSNMLAENVDALEESGLQWKESSLEQEGEYSKRKVNLLNIAGKGLAGLGRLVGKRISLEKKYNPDTDRTHIAFNTLGIGFSTSKKVR